MEIEIDLNKSTQENIANYYERSKKAKRKIMGAEKAIQETKKKLAKMESEKEKAELLSKPREKRKKAWYESFHWFFTSDDFLAVAGRDAGSNETLVKKHMGSTDIYFHADIQGAPHTIIKSKDNSAPKQSCEEAAQFAATYSKAWKSGFASQDVYSVKPEQVSKSAPTGTSMGKGAFMIYGERNWYRKMPVKVSVGVEKFEGKFRVISGPESAIAKHALAYFNLRQGKNEKGKIAKLLREKFEKRLKQQYPEMIVDLDEIISALPAGEFDFA